MPQDAAAEDPKGKRKRKKLYPVRAMNTFGYHITGRGADAMTDDTRFLSAAEREGLRKALTPRKTK